jgi:hypothetical protein
MDIKYFTTVKKIVFGEELGQDIEGKVILD